jgi:hypothetical protein
MYIITATLDGTDTIIHGRLDPNARIGSGKLTENVNTIPKFCFSIYPNNPGYSMIESMKTLVESYDRKNEETLFKGRVYSVSDIMDADGMVYKTVTCEGELAYLCDTIQQPRKFDGQPCQLSEIVPGILSTHNSKVDSARTIYPGNISGVFTGGYANGYISTFNMITDVCDLAGCEFRLRTDNGTRYLDIAPTFGENSDTEIALSSNLISLQKTVEAKDIVTRFYPVGAVNPSSTAGERLKIAPEPYIENTTLKNLYGIVEASKIYDDIAPTDWSSGGAIGEARNRLYAAGLKDYNQMIGLLTSFTVNALDLSLINGNYDDLRMYNTYRVNTRLQGIDDEVRVTGRVLSLDEPQNPQLTFGVKQQTLTSIIAGR